MKTKLVLCLLFYIVLFPAYGKEAKQEVYFKILLGKEMARIYVYSQPAVSFTAAKEQHDLILSFNNSIKGDIENLYDNDKSFIQSAIIDENGNNLTLQFQDKINIIKWNINSGSDYHSIDIYYNEKSSSYIEDARDNYAVIGASELVADEVESLPIKQSNHIELMLDETGMKQWWQFNWDKPSAIALFILNDYIWIIFNYEIVLDIDYINEQLPDPLKLLQNNIDNYTVLKLFYPNISANDIKLIDHDKTWNIIIGDEIPVNLTEKRKKALAVSVEQSYSKVLISRSKFDDLLKLSDPISGDTFFIATMQQPNTHIAQQHNFVDFTLLPTINGVVIYTNADYINPKIITRGIEIETTGWNNQLKN